MIGVASWLLGDIPLFAGACACGWQSRSYWLRAHAEAAAEEHGAIAHASSASVA